MKTFKKNAITHEFLGFVIVSGFAAFLNFTSRIIFNLFFSFSVSVFFAFIIGLVSAFVMNKLYVFKTAKKETTKQFLYFTLVNLIALLQTFFVSMLLENYILEGIGIVHYSKGIAHLTGICVPILSSYYGHKYMTFSKKVKHKEKGF